MGFIHFILYIKVEKGYKDNMMIYFYLFPKKRNKQVFMKTLFTFNGRGVWEFSLENKAVEFIIFFVG